MRRFLLLVSALAILVSCAGVVFAQPPGGRPGRGGPGMMRRGGADMLRIPEVQRELRLTAAQLSQLEAAQEKLRGGMRSMMEQAGDAGPSQEQRAALRAAQDKAVAAVLDSTQMLRYHQLELQQLGAMALGRPEVAGALALTGDQQKQIAELLKQAEEARRPGGQGGNFQDLGPEERAALRAKMDETRKATEAKLEAALTDAQKAGWKALLGAPFTFPPPAMGRGPEGGRRAEGDGGR
jgi:hypothetical protein